MLITIPLTLETMQQLIIKPPRRSQGLCCRKKLKNMKKLQIFLKIATIRDIKSWRTFHYIYKLCSNILSKHRWSSVALEARETKKNDKKNSKNLKKLQI